MVALAEVPVAERGAREHVHRTEAGAVGLAAAVALHQLGFLVFGEHALELDQQLVLGGIATRALDELHPHPGAGELLDQQRLVGELAGEPVRGVAQHHIHAPLGGQVAQRFQGGADQRRPGVALVLEHPLLRQVSPQLPGVGAQRRRLRADRLVLLLPGAGDPGVDRRARQDQEGRGHVVVPVRHDRAAFLQGKNLAAEDELRLNRPVAHLRGGSLRPR